MGFWLGTAAVWFPPVDVLALHPRGAEVRSGWVTASPVLADGPWHGDDCVMQRDPAVPVTHAAGYTLYPSEVDAMLGVWGPRLFGPRDHLLYREDPAALDAVMPVSLYTDMRHWLEWRRLGVVLVEDLVLAEPTGPL